MSTDGALMSAMTVAKVTIPATQGRRVRRKTSGSVARRAAITPVVRSSDPLA